MGSLVLPVRDLFSQPQLVLDQWMPLDGALSESEILLRAELKARDHTHAHAHTCACTHAHTYTGQLPLFLYFLTNWKCVVDRS